MRKTTTLIAGQEIHSYTTDTFSTSTRPVLGLFVLHGRLGSHESSYIQDLIQAFVDAAEAQGEKADKDLLVIALDHRNHGKRLLSENANNGFESNPTHHAIDMYAIQSGTCKDCSFVMNLLEAYLFPCGERTICEWGVVGVSLGGHSAWILAATDSRVKLCVPIIGCPDYMALMSSRAGMHGIAVAPPHFPRTLLTLIQTEALDPQAFKGKHVLVLSGGNDPVVPWVASQSFVEKVDVADGSKKVIVFDDAAHEVTPGMAKAAVDFIVQFLSVVVHKQSRINR